ncbi:hypothetical protein BH23ACT5_BH23ACT5_01660 [soil metagenome]
MLEAWFFIAAVLLIVSGGLKLIDPAPTRGALQAAGLPAGRWASPALGFVEILAGTTGLIIGGWAAGLVFVVYAGFAGFVVYALWRQLPISSCGCFGKPDTPPTRIHVAFNLLSAVAAAGVVLTGQAPVDILLGQPLWGLPYLGHVALGVTVVYLLLAELPATLSAGKGR